jgi:NAD(P)H dehydrogenase (quinone)
VRIVVTTPTGNVGSRVLQLLVQAGVRPVALMRDPARLDPRWRDAVETVTADQTDADAVREATCGADRLFWVNPPAPPDADPLESQARAAEAVAGAVTANGIGFTVFQSSVGAELRSGAGDIDGLGRTEEALDATGADVLHLRCGYFFTNLLMQAGDIRNGSLPTPWPLDLPLAWVDPRDIGDVAAARLLAGSPPRRRVQAVHGPEDLSFAGAASELGAALGRPVEAVRISGDAFRAGLGAAGLAAAHVDAVAGMWEGLSDGFVAEDPRDATTTTPTTLGAWAHTHLRET